MKIESRAPQLVAKKMWNIARIVLYMLRQSMSKSKLMLDLQVMLKKGKNIAGNAIGDLMLRHHYSSAFTCRSDQDVAVYSFVSPREYEFSCSNSPAFPIRRKSHRGHNHNHNHNHSRRHHRPGKCLQPQNNDDVTLAQKVLDMLNTRYNDHMVEASPLALPGFGKSPLTVRQLRITDSPYPLKELEENPQVDKDAEEFINKFYKDLKQQKKIAAVGSPLSYHVWAR